MKNYKCPKTQSKKAKVKRRNPCVFSVFAARSLICVVFYGRWVFVLFDGLYFFNSPEVSAACEIGAEPDLDHSAQEDLAEKFARDTEDVCVVVMA